MQAMQAHVKGEGCLKVFNRPKYLESFKAFDTLSYFLQALPYGCPFVAKFNEKIYHSTKKYTIQRKNISFNEKIYNSTKKNI